MISCDLRNDSKGFQPLAADIQGVETPWRNGNHINSQRAKFLPFYSFTKDCCRTRGMIYTPEQTDNGQRTTGNKRIPAK